MTDLRPIQTIDEFEAEVAPIVTPAFSSKFGGIRWRDLGAKKAAYEWLVKGLLARREVSFLAGPSQSGKSFLTTDLALAVARGVPWFGRATRQGAVVYIAAESQQGVQALRLPAYATANGLTYEADDLPFLLITRPPNFFTEPDGVKLLSDEIAAYEKDIGQKVELVVIDTYSAATRGIDELKGKDLGVVRANVQTIADKNSTGVLIVHHTNASGERMKGNGQNFSDANDVLMCSIKEGAADADGRQLRTMSAPKVKEGANKSEIDFVLRQVIVGRDDDGDVVTSCVVSLPREGEGQHRDPQAKGVSIPPQAGVFLKAIYEAIEEQGEKPPISIPNQKLKGAVKVVAWKYVRAKFAMLSFDDDADEDPKKRDEAFRKALSRNGEKLVSMSIIDRWQEGKDAWVWLTGKRVKGFRDLNREERDRENPPKPSSTAAPAPPVDPGEGVDGWSF